MKTRFIFPVRILFILFSVAVYAQQIDMNAVNSADNFRWGVYAFNKSYYNEAVRSFELALGFKPRDTRTKAWLGRVLYKSGFEEAALNEWNMILNAGTKDPLLENLVQVINLRRGISRELGIDKRLVVTRTLDAGNNTYYEFKRPTSVKPRKNGSFFMVAYGTSEILVINANGIVTDVYKGDLSPFNNPFDHPFDVVESEDGTFFVSEYEGDRIAKCRPDGSKVKTFGKKGTGEGELLGPQYLAMDNKGYLYVTDWGNKRVSKFDTDGNFIFSFGSRKEGESPESESVLAAPTGIAVYNEHIYVADKTRKRIAVYDRSGNYITSLGTGELWGPEGLFVTDNKTILIADTLGFAEKTRIMEMEIEKEKIEPVPGTIDKCKRIMSAAIDTNRNLIAVDFDMNKVFILSRMSDLYSGYFVEIQRIDSDNFPEVTADIAVQDRYGNPVYGLEKQNFILTEMNRPVTGVTMYNPVNVQSDLELVLLVEKSPEMEKHQADLKKSIEDIMGLLGKDKVSLISAGETGVIEIESSASATEITEKAVASQYTKNWKLDTGIRLAATKTLSSRFRRAIIFISTGNLGTAPFGQYSLLELRQFLKNNYISFNFINLGADEPSEELLFLCRETGGDYYSYYIPAGILSIISRIREKPDPRYILKYQSHTFPDFGNRYIEMSAEVILNKVSGRDMLGYYSPLK